MVLVLNLRLNYAIRTIPLLIYAFILFYVSLISFDFWSPMININKSIFNWFLAGVFNVIFIFLFFYIRLMIIRLSFQNMNRNIPHTDFWEQLQFIITILFLILVVVNGLLLTFFVYNNKTFQILQICILMIPLIIDLLFHLKWVLF